MHYNNKGNIPKTLLKTTKVMTKNVKATSKKVKANKKETIVTGAVEAKKTAKKVKTTSSSKSPKEKVVEKVTKKTKNNLLEPVISNREVKYIYPEDINDPISRKKYRQEIRNKIKKFIIELNAIEDKLSKEYLKKEKEYKAYLKKVQKAA